ncbi:hypothetical protein [Flavobacterium sp.]|uniref:hypothetical protein n=1 Tax=Flavobacterium sp. TaxID=239 RepID=UPI001B417937|nr:hypothetical protein [Flavobacterium sp.]MBP6182988.1 hypothetical protein [Flavobacterium sp.]
MYIGIKHLHSFTAWLTLAFLIIAVGYAFYCRFSSKPFTKVSKALTVLGLIGTHTQFVFGLLLYFLSPLGVSNFSGGAMGNSVSRLYILEHPLMMIIAVGLITYGYSKAKRLTDDKAKFNKITVFYTLGLIAIISRIPWSAWL